MLWRYSKKTVIGWNPTQSTARVYNSSVLRYNNEFVGVFRADHKNGKAFLHFDRSKDVFNFEIDDNVIPWQDENGNPNPISYDYDPSFLKLEDNYYVVWCDNMRGASIGMGRTKDLKTWIRIQKSAYAF